MRPRISIWLWGSVDPWVHVFMCSLSFKQNRQKWRFQPARRILLPDGACFVKTSHRSQIFMKKLQMLFKNLQNFQYRFCKQWYLRQPTGISLLFGLVPLPCAILQFVIFVIFFVFPLFCCSSFPLFLPEVAPWGPKFGASLSCAGVKVVYEPWHYGPK